MRPTALLFVVTLSLTTLGCEKLANRHEDTDSTLVEGDIADDGTAPVADTVGPSGEDIASGDAALALEVIETGDADVVSTPTDPWQLTLTCDDPAQAIYDASIADVDPAAPLGTVVACRQDPLLAADDVAEDAAEDGVVTTAAIRPYRIAYVTERSAGARGLGTARVMLPDPLPAAPAHVVVITHGTTGLADACAPSVYPQVRTEMALPFAGTDMVVVAPDYAGLGNEGTQGYGESGDTAHSVLDALRAVHALFSPGTLTDSYAVMGHSQGGGAALYAQGLAGTYGSKHSAKAIVAFSPGWVPSAEQNRAPYAFPQFVPVTLAAGVTVATYVLALYADVANHIDAATPGLFFHADWRTTLVEWIETLCVFPIADNLWALGASVTLADIIDPDFLAGVLSCIDETPSCTEPYLSFVERRRGNYIPPDPGGAPILYVQGLEDAQSTPERAMCNLEAMAGVGVTPQVCTDDEATHFDVVSRNLSVASDWLRAQLNGTPVPTCEHAEGLLPPCE
ncbi:MAG: lipase family protein [Myxococcota bacterium]|nr:lipase family protein [Myxococcota bacterium]